ncbi:hypothetical protein B0H14DRAFT_3095490 [Mycena olivaceomarginata]|nr:hypothetical protein B0H14DRAFT_3095490 [Mycena olivaceomarginata]
MPDTANATLPPPTREAQKAAEDQFHRRPIIMHYPSNVAGQPLRSDRSKTTEQAYKSSLNSSADENPYTPFKSKMDWEVGKWAKLRGSGSTVFTDLLQVEGVRETLDLSYKTAAELNKIIDNKLLGSPKFSHSKVIINGEVFHLYSRDILKCVRCQNLDAIIILIIISSDKTQLTVFGNKTTYPIYMTIRNIPKEIRCKPWHRGYILLGYLLTSCMKHVKNKAAQRRILANIFHVCMSYMLEPLKSARITGLPMTSGDGVTCCGHPIYETFVGDYPEQVLMTAVKMGECPTCDIPCDELGLPSDYPLRDLEKILEALETLDSGPSVYAAACKDAGIKPIYHPFWEGLPYTNIFQAISPDVLHRLYQGIVKHLIAWLTECVGEAEIDAHCCCLPPNHNICLFIGGISNLSHVTGKEHDRISCFILTLIINVQLPDNISPAPLLAAVRGILDFVHLAQYPMHTLETLAHLENTLQHFHNNKSIFVASRVRKGFNLPKLHSCHHYIMYIKLFGTTDNYNTEYTGRLHIDLTKDTYRSTNFKDEFPQMTLWLERKEKVYHHEKYIQWHLDSSPAPPTAETLPPGIVYKRRLKMTENPTLKAVQLTHLVTDYGAKFFRDALARYFIQLNYHTLSFSFNSIPVFHRIKFTTEDPYTARGPKDTIVDSIHVQPSTTLKNGELLPARFDTVLINDGTGRMTGVSGYHVVQIHIIFTLGQHQLRHLFLPGVVPLKYLAYIEWFSLFTMPEPDHLMYKVNRSLKDGERLFRPVAPATWKSSTVLDQCTTFFVNSMTDCHIYATIF